VLVFMIFHARIGEFLGGLIGDAAEDFAEGLVPGAPRPSGQCPPGTSWPGVPFASGVCFPNGIVPGQNPGGGMQNPSGSPDCIWPWRRDPITGDCALFLGEVPGADPSPGGNGFAPQGSGSRIHGEFFHQDSVPKRVSVSVRRCPPGSVLGKDRWCHPKGSIANRERLYPRPTPPLGTSAQMKAITVAGQFGRRLKTKRKTLKKLSNLFSSC